MNEKGKVVFIEPPPAIDWTPGDTLSTAGRRHPSKNITGEKVYSYINLSSAAVLRENNFEVAYLHCQTMGLDLGKLEPHLEALRPGLIVIMLEHITISVSRKIADMAKARNVPVLFVGPLVTALDKRFIGDNGADFVLRGEWDYGVKELADCLCNNGGLEEIAGLTYLKNGLLVKNPDRSVIEDLDALPFPAYDLVDLGKFYESVFTKFPAATAITSRGCPFDCAYCVFPNTIYSHRFRAQSPERVVAEAKYLQDRFKVKEVRYDDDTFDIDEERVLRICELFRKEKIEFRWMIQARPGMMTGEKARALKKAGCTMLLYGVESGNNDVLKKINKKTTKEEIQRGVQIAHQYGLDVLNCVMLGFYWDTTETIQETIDFAFKLNAEFTQFSIPIPLPGTRYYDLLKKEDFIVSDNLEQGDSFYSANVDFPHLKREFLDQNLRNIYRRYYVRPKYIARMLIRIVRNPLSLFQLFRLINAYFKRWKAGWI